MKNFAKQGFSKIYGITCYWGPRADTPAAMAPRFLRSLEALSRISTAFGDWYIGRKKGRRLAPLSRAQIVQYIADGNDLEKTGDTDPREGYSFGATTGIMKDPRDFTVDFRAGRSLPGNFFINTASIESWPLCEENASLISLPLFKPALLVLTSLWQPMWGGIGPWGLFKLEPERDPRQRPRFGLEWVTYLSPRFAPMVTPPPFALTEYLPDGALLMIATEERFSVGNPHHIAVARDIEAAMAPINALPWPPDAEIR